MPRTVINRFQLNRDPRSGTAVSWQPADVANGNAFRVTGREVLLVYNSGDTAANLTIASIQDPYRRERDISESIPANAYYLYGPFSLEAWRQSDGNVYVNATSANVRFLLISLV